MMSCLRLRALVVAAAVLALCVAVEANAAKSPKATSGKITMTDPLPEPMREFRGVWVATVGNIDWPSKPGLSVEEQKAELIRIMDKCKELNMNCVVFHVRPACDAMYKSDLEPWSPFLTGEMGKAPEPFYDPLQMAVEEAHKRGMELHAWFNPYRAMLDPDKTKASEGHISKKNPKIVKRYDEFLWLDPSDKATQAHSLAVVLDVVKRYDIDGIHVDDYFYPYPVDDKKTKQEIPFPDEENYAAYKKSGGKLSRDDWRRDHVNQFIKSFYTETKKIKPWVKVGISPFGIWKPGYPAQIKGFSQYDKLYADALLWLHNGWTDYFTPQLYWPVSPPDQSFVTLLQWWCDESAKTSNRPIWTGLFTSKYNDTKSKFGSDEIINQIKWTRLQKNGFGQVHFSMKNFFRDPDGLNDKLTTHTDKLKGPYLEPAVVPAMPWLDGKAPAAPKLTVAQDKATTAILGVKWEPASKADAEDMRFWLVQWRAAGVWKENLVGADKVSMDFKSGDQVDRVAVRGVDRSSNLSSPADSK